MKKRNKNFLRSLLGLLGIGGIATIAFVGYNNTTFNNYNISLKSSSNDFINDTYVELSPRTLSNSVGFITYPTPHMYSASVDSTNTDYYETTFTSHTLAPDYVQLWNLLGISVPESYTQDPEDFFDQNGWPLHPEHLTYHQFFLNSKLASFFCTLAEGTSGNIDSSYVSASQIITNLQTQSASGNDVCLDLEGDFLSDPYADDTVKVLNCPFFYEIPSGYSSSIYSYFTSIDLSNNDLWYVPFFGYVDVTPSSESTYEKCYIFRATNETIASSDYGSSAQYSGFSNLSDINLSNNHLTILPYTFAYRSASSHIKEAGYDITNLMATSTTTYGTIEVYGNYLRNLFSPSISELDAPLYQYTNVLVTSPDSTTEEDLTNNYQTTAIYTNTNVIKLAINNFILEKYGVEPSSLKLSTTNQDLANLIPELSLLTSSKEYTNGECLEALIITYLNENFLSSNYIFDELTDMQILVNAIYGSNNFYAYPDYSTNTGQICLSINVGDPNFCSYENEDYTIYTPSSTIAYFFSISISGYQHVNVMWILEGIILGCIAFALISIIIYCLFFKKKVIEKRKQKDIQMIYQDKK